MESGRKADITSVLHFLQDGPNEDLTLSTPKLAEDPLLFLYFFQGSC